ncbi:MAG: hypothetical protein EpisKO_09400 [Epibacterium sp.]
MTNLDLNTEALKGQMDKLFFKKRIDELWHAGPHPRRISPMCSLRLTCRACGERASMEECQHAGVRHL